MTLSYNFTVDTTDSKPFSLRNKLKSIAASRQSWNAPIDTETYFDWHFYVSYYKDLNDTSSYDEAYEHWIIFGQVENRFPNEAALEAYLALKSKELPDDFDPCEYLALNPDLKEQLAADRYERYKATEHFLQYGQPEGRLYRREIRYTPEPTAKKPEKNHQVSSLIIEVEAPSEPDLQQVDVRLIAFYLPQFHPIPENDRWWGKGFTEWTNVSRAKPLFDGHYQPHLPSDLGFYDLRVPEVREAQAQLAKKYGIHGFCYYYYWFAGKRLLNRPLDDVLASKEPNFPFCICWANENWTRRWDGQDHEVLIAQDFSDEQNQAFAESIVPILKDERYIRLNGLPFLLIYRADIFPDALHTTNQWRNIFREHGVGEVHLAVALTCFSGLLSGLTDPTQLGFDSAVQFAPHEIPAAETSPSESLVPGFSGKLYDYKSAAINAVSAANPEAKVFLSAMPSWDNTARRKNTAHAFLNSNPQDYQFWLRGAIEKTRQRYVEDERIVFINAWNEWAEGAHLEPDQKYGHAFLIATHQALHGTHSWKTIIDLLRYLPLDNYTHLCELLEQLEQRIEAMNRSLLTMYKLLSQEIAEVVEIFKVESSADVLWNLDSLQQQQHVNLNSIELQGWGVGMRSPICAIDVRYNNHLIAQIPVYLNRPDVSSHFSKPDAQNCGFYAQININAELSPQIELDLWATLQDGRSTALGTVQLKSFGNSRNYIEQTSASDQLLINQIRDLRIEAVAQRQKLIEQLEEKMLQKENQIKASQSLLKQHSVHDFFERF